MKPVNYEQYFKDWKGNLSTLHFNLPSGNTYKLGPLPLSIQELEKIWEVTTAYMISSSMFTVYRGEDVIDNIKLSLNKFKRLQ